MTQPQIVLLTHVKHFIGPTAVHRLLREGMTVVCHDMAFADPAVREAFRAEVPGAEVCAATAPIELVAEIIDRFGRLDALVSNDPYPAVRAAVDEVGVIRLRVDISAGRVYVSGEVPHDLFEDILDRDYTLYVAVFIDHKCNPLLRLLKIN